MTTSKAQWASKNYIIVGLIIVNIVMGTITLIEYTEVKGETGASTSSSLHFASLFSLENVSQITKSNASAWSFSPATDWLTPDGTFQIQYLEGSTSHGSVMYIWIQIWSYSNPSLASFRYAILPSALGSEMLQGFPIPNYTLVVSGISTDAWQYKIFNNGLCTKNNTLNTIHCSLEGVEAMGQYVVSVSFSPFGPGGCCASPTYGINPANLNITSMTYVLNELASMIIK